MTLILGIVKGFTRIVENKTGNHDFQTQINYGVSVNVKQNILHF